MRVATSSFSRTWAPPFVYDPAISITRPDGRVAELTRPGQPMREVSLMARDTVEIIAEELRRLDPDEVYAEVLTAGVRIVELAR